MNEQQSGLWQGVFGLRAKRGRDALPPSCKEKPPGFMEHEAAQALGARREEAKLLMVDVFAHAAGLLYPKV